MYLDNLTISVMVWAAITIVIVAKLLCGQCVIKRMLGKPCKK